MPRNSIRPRHTAHTQLNPIGHTMTTSDEGCRALSRLTYRQVESAYGEHRSSARIVAKSFFTRRSARTRRGANLSDLPRATLGLLPIIAATTGTELTPCLVRDLMPLTEPVAPQLPFLRPMNPELTNFVYQQPLGLVTVSAGVDSIWLFAQVVMAFPAARFSIVCESLADVDRVSRTLARYGVPLNKTSDAGAGGTIRRIIVGTSRSTAEDTSAIGLRDMVIFLDAVEAIGERPQDMFASPHARFRLLGFVSGERSLSPRQHDLLMAAYGPERLHIPAHGFSERVVRVASYEYRHSTVFNELNPFVTRRKLIWRDHIRNSRIARLASLLSTGDGAALHEFAPGLASHLSVVSPRSVTIIVDAVEHAVELAKRLKSATVMCSPDVNLDGLSSTDRRILAPRPWSWHPSNLVIATPDAIETMPPGSLQTVIWAGSGPHRPLLPEPQLAVPAGRPDDGVLIVDVGDYHTPLLQQWTRQRRREYERAEWLPVGVDRVEHRIERFLASRPGGQR